MAEFHILQLNYYKNILEIGGKNELALIRSLAVTEKSVALMLSNEIGIKSMDNLQTIHIKMFGW